MLQQVRNNAGILIQIAYGEMERRVKYVKLAMPFQTLDAILAKRALLDAIQMQQPNSKNLMFHSDQGVQYTAPPYIKTVCHYST